MAGLNWKNSWESGHEEEFKLIFLIVLMASPQRMRGRKPVWLCLFFRPLLALWKSLIVLLKC